MKYGRLGFVALAAAIFLVAARPASALIAVCIAQDSDTRTYVSKQPSVFDWQARNFAQSLVMAECQARSQHPESCKIVSCTVTE